MTERAITPDTFGAWLIKCDPETKFDLPGWLADGNPAIYDWSVKRNYRSDLVAAGDPIILWVSGNGKKMDRGIWGLGYVTGPVEDAIPLELNAVDIGYWHDAGARRAVELFVPLDLPVLDSPVLATDVLAAGLTDLEVVKVPAGSNPSWVSKEQLERLMPLLPPWPDAGPLDEELTISPTAGAGFGSPDKNAIVEAAAMQAVIEHYRGWEHEDVSSDKVGWDITFTKRSSGERARVEVKGVSSGVPTVLLTRNELKAARTKSDWRLAVVTRALSDPKVHEYTSEEVLAAAEPYVYKATLPATS